jgi:PAS domain S-box-containing protein
MVGGKVQCSMTLSDAPHKAQDEAAGSDASSADDHYLKQELYDLVQSDPAIFEFIQSGSLDGIWFWDLTEPEIEWMSPRFWEVLGFDPGTKTHLAAEWQDLIFEEDLRTASENFERHCADPSHPYDQTVRYRHRDGHTVWVRCRGIAIRDENGTPIRLLGAHTDLTRCMNAQGDLEKQAAELRHKAAELEGVNEQLRETRRLLEEELESRGRQVASLSHELRNPLSALLGFAEVLTDDRIELDDEERDQMIQTISQEGQDVLHLVEDLLATARADAGELAVTSVSVNLRAQAAQVLESLDPQSVSGVSLRGDSVRAIGDPTRVRQILRNLVSNALRYGGDEVEIVVATEGNAAIVTVSDDGPAIPPSDVERIFEPYQRAATARVSTASVGLGLSVSRQLARLMGGSLVYHHDHGRSSFRLALPMRAVDA